MFRTLVAAILILEIAACNKAPEKTQAPQEQPTAAKTEDKATTTPTPGKTAETTATATEPSRTADIATSPETASAEPEEGKDPAISPQEERSLRKKTEVVLSPNAPTGAEKVVAWNAQRRITLTQFEQYLMHLPAFQRREYASLEKKSELLKNMIKFETLAELAQEAGYRDNADVQLAMKTEMVRCFLKDRFESEEGITVEEAEIEQRYQRDPGRFHKPERLRAYQILIREKGEGEKILTELRQRVAAPGTNVRRVFREFVRKYSLDEVTKKRGGDLLFFDAQGNTDGDAQLDPAVVQAAFAIQNTDQISNLIKGRDGYYILLVTHRREKVERSLEDVHQELHDEILREKQEAAREKFLTEVVPTDSWHIETPLLSEIAVEGMPDSSDVNARIKAVKSMEGARP